MKLSLTRVVLIGIGLAIVGMIAYAFAPKPIGVDLVSVTAGSLRVSIDEDGKTRIRERYVISAPVDGRLRRIERHAGDEVEAGQTLVACIDAADPALLDARAQVEAEARVAAAQAALKRAGPVLERALAQLELARSERQRIGQLFQTQAATAKELDDAVLLERVQAQEVKAARFAQEITGFELKMAQAALLWSGPRTKGQAGSGPFEIFAPCGGRVLRVFQENAAVISAGTALLEIGDPTDLEVEIDVLSTDAVKIRPGMDVWLEQWGGSLPLGGTVRLVEPSAFTKVSALGVEEQRVNVIVDFLQDAQDHRTLGDGYRVEARIVVWEAPNVLKVPTNAMFRHNGQWAVFLVVNRRAELRPVKIGRRNGLEAQVLAGLGKQDQVIVHPSDKISAGVAVVAR